MITLIFIIVLVGILIFLFLDRPPEQPDWYYCENDNCHGHDHHTGITVTCPDTK